MTQQSDNPNAFHDRRFAWIAVIAAVALIFIFREAAAVFAPIAIAAFIVAAFAPLYDYLRERLGHVASASITSVVATIVAVLLAGAMGWGLYALYEELSAKQDAIEEATRSLTDWAEKIGISGAGGGGISSSAQALGKELFSVGSQAVLGLGLAVLFWLSLPAISWSFDRALGETNATAWRHIATKTTRDVYRYIIARTLAGLGTGIVVALSCWALGLQLALFWGLLNFILNYIPTLGSVLAVIPPALFAYIQTGEVTMALAVLGTVGLVQLFFGLVIDPIIQGAYLKFPAFNILIFITFWGWLWGIPGAFLATPIMTFLAYVLFQQKSTRALAISMTDRNFDFNSESCK